MYGTVARMRVKPGMEAQVMKQFRDFEAAHVSGAVGVYCYRMDADAQNYCLSVVFESKEAYRANAESAEQDRRYHQLLSLLESEPEWNDGEIIYSFNQPFFSSMKTSTVQTERRPI